MQKPNGKGRWITKKRQDYNGNGTTERNQKAAKPKQETDEWITGTEGRK